LLINDNGFTSEKPCPLKEGKLGINGTFINVFSTVYSLNELFLCASGWQPFLLLRLTREQVNSRYAIQMPVVLYLACVPQFTW
jgi:hypothetical protein